MSDNPSTPVTQPTGGETGGVHENPNTTTNTGSGNSRAGNTRPFIKKTGKGTPFRGETLKMNGNVFQLHAERKSKSQFGDTVKALRVSSSEVFKNNIEPLTILFTDLSEPILVESEEPKTVGVMGEDGKIKQTISKFEEMKYAEKVKQWI